ncbi:DUF6980 family protein [Candidatus Jidaibacter acanthamoebae]|nr:hypothetical protein [Candidatus Jidaibacter acanthamoeba]
MYKGKVEGRTLMLLKNRAEDQVLNCCTQMAFHAKEKEQLIIYEPIMRRIGIRVSDSTFQLINHCPWCGSKLPNELSEELSTIVFDQLCLEGYDDPKLPEEFKTDEWWKKRGL